MARTDLDRRMAQLCADLWNLACGIDQGLDRLLHAVQHHDPVDARLAQLPLRHSEEEAAAIEEHITDLFLRQQPIVARDLRLLLGALEVLYHLRECGSTTLQQAVALALSVQTCQGESAETVLTQGGMTRHHLLTATDAFLHGNRHLAETMLEAQPTGICNGVNDVSGDGVSVDAGACHLVCGEFLRALKHIEDHVGQIAHRAARL